MEILSVLITAALSVFTAMIILKLQNWIHKRNIFNALRSEIESNLSLAKKILPLVENLSREGSKKEHKGTVFDLQRLHTYSYEDFRRTGYLLSLNQKAKELLEEVYELILSHNHQTDSMRGREIDFSNPKTMFLSSIPRTRGYTERLKLLIDKLRLLKEEF